MWRMCSKIHVVPCVFTESADGLCCKLSQICGKPRSLSWASERGKEDDYTTSKETVQLTKRIGSGQFADVWLGNVCYSQCFGSHYFIKAAFKHYLSTSISTRKLKVNCYCSLRADLDLATELLQPTDLDCCFDLCHYTLKSLPCPLQLHFTD